MLASIPMIALLAIAWAPQATAVGPKVPAIAPFVGDEVIAVVHVHLARWQVPATVRKLFGKLADEADLADVVATLDGRLEALKKAGATDLFLLIDPADFPGLPVVVVPLSGEADAPAIAKVLTGEAAPGQARWAESATIRGAVVAGSRAAMARIRDLKAAARPELIAAMGSGGDPSIRVVLTPSKAQRRAIEESLPYWPAEVGGGPIETLTRGMSWASASLGFEPGASIGLIVQARDADSAKLLGQVARNSLGFVATASRSNPSTADLADAVDRMKPEVTGDRITLEANLEKTAALVSVPIRQYREAGHRGECVDNLKQIGLAMHNYHGTYNTFPAAFTSSKDGKPLLSWRVQMLPYLDQLKPLYDQFRQDEPWDSPHNKRLIPLMPKAFACPGARQSLAAEGKTTYLTPRGVDTLFPGATPIKIQEITDGTSNTIMAIDVDDDLAVTWTRPDDWAVGPELKTQGLFGHHPLGTNFGFADGSVRFLRRTISASLLQGLLTRNAGEVLKEDDL